MAKKNPSCRAWAFTLQVASVEEARAFKPALNDSVSFVRYQLEVAPSTGQLHLQGCVRTSTASRLNKIKSIVSERAHCEPARDWKALKDYCAKAESRHPAEIAFEWGTDIGQGSRQDLESLAKVIVDGGKLRDVAVTEPGMFVRYHKGLRALEAIVHEPRTMLDRRCVLLWGDTGVGKTRMAYDLFPMRDIYTVFDVKTPWFDGYEGQRVAILDEMGEGCMNYNFLKRVCDIHPMTVPCKGGSIAWTPEVIILTSNTKMEEWWVTAKRVDLEALKRRIRVFHLPHEEEDAKRYVLHGQVQLRKRDRSPVAVLDEQEVGSGAQRLPSSLDQFLDLTEPRRFPDEAIDLLSYNA